MNTYIVFGKKWAPTVWNDREPWGAIPPKLMTMESVPCLDRRTYIFIISLLFIDSQRFTRFYSTTSSTFLHGPRSNCKTSRTSAPRARPLRRCWRIAEWWPGGMPSMAAIAARWCTCWKMLGSSGIYDEDWYEDWYDWWSMWMGMDGSKPIIINYYHIRGNKLNKHPLTSYF